MDEFSQHLINGMYETVVLIPINIHANHALRLSNFFRAQLSSKFILLLNVKMPTNAF